MLRPNHTHLHVGNVIEGLNYKWVKQQLKEKKYGKEERKAL